MWVFEGQRSGKAGGAAPRRGARRASLAYGSFEVELITAHADDCRRVRKGDGREPLIPPKCWKIHLYALTDNGQSNITVANIPILMEGGADVIDHHPYESLRALAFVFGGG